MKINKIDIKNNIGVFDDTSDMYTDIYLTRKNKEITTISYNDNNFYLNIGEDGRINKIEVILIKNKFIKKYIEIPKIKFKGEVFLEFLKNKDDEDYIENRDIEVEINFNSENLVFYFDKTKNIDYGVQISDKIVVLVGENNIMKGILINGKFKIGNDRFYYEK
ncbi:Uncharacterised protein [uncultured Leptotrichia sp.]|jgi:hypothetical protein|uniref:hypothetical protein n=1 Tax=uncultured Leptotrichia sp. TaxID=159271 RepID=UPI001A5274CA|nr:hypothetical protein [uncultured Leptotrichia sp.]VTX79243.1 Uncharacterised protein [uncultured Leptotrichia sp.]